jgi:hypothetical protein
MNPNEFIVYCSRDGIEWSRAAPPGEEMGERCPRFACSKDTATALSELLISGGWQAIVCPITLLSQLICYEKRDS